MNELNEIPIDVRDNSEADRQNEAVRSMHRRPPVSTDPARVEELERENVRLQLLVAELLMKNQQLRKAD